MEVPQNIAQKGTDFTSNLARRRNWRIQLLFSGLAPNRMAIRLNDSCEHHQWDDGVQNGLVFECLASKLGALDTPLGASGGHSENKTTAAKGLTGVEPTVSLVACSSVINAQTGAG